MKYIHDKLKQCTSHFITEEYIPLTIEFNKADYNLHVGFYYEDTDLVEFSLNPDTLVINKFVLSFTSHYRFLDEEIKIPFSENGEVTLLCGDKNLCSDFLVTVFNNGVHIRLSDIPVDKYISSGQLTLGMDTSSSISEIFIGTLDSREIAFIKNELELG